MAPQKQKQSGISKFQLLIAALTIILSILGTLITMSFIVGKQVTQVTTSIDSLKIQLQETNFVLKQLKNDNTGFKISNAQVKKDITGLDNRIGKIQPRLDKAQDRVNKLQSNMSKLQQKNIK